MKEGLNDKHDQVLDDLIKNSLKEYDIPYQKEDWEKMASLLESNNAETLPVNGNNFGFREFLALFLLLLGAGTILFVLLDQKSAATSNHPDYLLTQVHDHQLEINIPKDLSFHIQTKMAVSAVDFEEVNLRGSKSDKVGNAGSATNLEELATLGNKKLTAERISSSFLVPIVAKKPGPEILNWNLNQAANQQKHLLRSSIEKENPTGKDLFSLSQTSGLYSKFSLALIFSPEFNSGPNSRGNGFGKSAGLNLEYFINRNLSINTGAFYAFKGYVSEEEYQNGSYYPFELNGNCWILDIPLNIRYYAINRPKTRFYLSSGISSYLMLQEEYLIDYGPNSAKDSYSYRVNGQNQHYFGILNFGAGLERNLSGNWSLQIEPYLKLPVNGIGEHALNINSAGAWLGLKYRW